MGLREEGRGDGKPRVNGHRCFMYIQQSVIWRRNGHSESARPLALMCDPEYTLTSYGCHQSESDVSPRWLTAMHSVYGRKGNVVLPNLRSKPCAAHHAQHRGNQVLGFFVTK